jgi:anthranilate phosphoribosyltransferase
MPNSNNNTTSVADRLHHLVTLGTYQDFLDFLDLTTDKKFDYLTEIAQTLLSMCKRVNLPFNAIDICGTGGDISNLTNISTISAFVLASMGIPVVKHGGKAVSSSSGSIDFLDALKIPEINPVESVKKYNLCFLKAQNYHTSFKYIAQFRKEYGKKTIFNMLGPLINPATISHQMVGVACQTTQIQSYATALQKLGRKSFAVVQSTNGKDELLSFEENIVYRGSQEGIQKYILNPKDYNLSFTIDDSIAGGTPQENAENALRFFEKPTQSTLCETIMLNCGVAIVIFEMVKNINEGIDLAKDIIFSKKPLELIHSMQTNNS